MLIDFHVIITTTTYNFQLTESTIYKKNVIDHE